MPEQDQVARWIIGLRDEGSADERTLKFLECSSRAWSSALAHVRRELAGKALNKDEIDSLALEIWEKTLRSVWRTWQWQPSAASRIENLEDYLMGAFHHRLNRHLKRQRLRDSVLEFRPLEELEQMKGAVNVDHDFVSRVQRGIQLQEAYTEMKDEIRLALSAKLYGFSWQEIAKRFHIDEQNLIMRVQYATRKIRRKLNRANARKGKGCGQDI